MLTTPADPHHSASSTSRVSLLSLRLTHHPLAPQMLQGYSQLGPHADSLTSTTSLIHPLRRFPDSSGDSYSPLAQTVPCGTCLTLEVPEGKARPLSPSLTCSQHLEESLAHR